MSHSGISASSSASPRLRVVFLLLSALSISCTHRQIVKSTPPPTVWDRQIRNAVDAGDGDYRLRALGERVAAEPENIAIRIELANAYRERNYPEIALEISRLAVGRFPNSADAQLSLIRDLRAVNRRAEAIGALEAFLKEHPAAEPGFWSWLGILRDESGLFPSAEPAHRKALEASPAADYLHNNLGYNLLMQNKHEDAAAEFREALRLNPASEVARNNLGTALANSNATAQALATWQSATDAASAHNNLAAVWMEKGNYPEAHKELDLALGYNRSHPAALRNLELLARLDGQPATLAAAPGDLHRNSVWSRFKRLFVGPLNDSKDGADKTASSR